MRDSSATAKLTVALNRQRVEVRLPAGLATDFARLFPANLSSYAPASRRITVHRHQTRCYSLCASDSDPVVGLSRPELLILLMEEVTRLLITDLDASVALHAGVVGQNGRAILLPGPTGSGKSSLTAWLVSEGFDYLSDEIAILTQAGAIDGFARPLVVKPGAAQIVQTFTGFDETKTVRCGAHLLKVPAQAKIVTTAQTPGLIVIPNYQSGAEVAIEPLSPGEVALRLVACNLNARNLQDGGFARITALSRNVPAVLFRFGGFDQLKGSLDTLINFAVTHSLTATKMHRFLTAFSKQQAPVPARRYPVPVATPRKRAKVKLTVGMTTYDDYDGVYFSLQALRLYHPEVLDDIELLLIDNHPEGPCSESLKQLDRHAKNYRYVPETARRGTAVRDKVFAEAAGKFVLCIDCHVLIVPGALKRLIDYFDANSRTSDLIQGPLLDDKLALMATHFRPEWRKGLFGTWERDERGSDPDAEPFEVLMQGLGLFACRKAAWPGFNPNFRGFGGEEGYIHEKFRQRGHRTVCLPFLRWLHRFNRPLGLPYSNTWEDRIRNYVIGWQELGLPTKEIRDHFSALLGVGATDRIFRSLELAGVYTSAETAPSRSSISTVCSTSNAKAGPASG